MSLCLIKWVKKARWQPYIFYILYYNNIIKVWAYHVGVVAATSLHVARHLASHDHFISLSNSAGASKMSADL